MPQLPDLTPHEAAPLIQGLIQACNLISDPFDHSTHELARNADNQKVSPFSPDACKFCSVGAVQHTFRHSMRQEDQALRILQHFLSNGDSYITIHSLNDLLPHDQLMARWVKALNAMKEHYAYGLETKHAA